MAKKSNWIYSKDNKKSFWKNMATLGLGIIVVVMMLKTFSDSPSLTGYAVYDTADDSKARFSGTFSVLLFIFLIFSFLILVFTKKVALNKKEPPN